MARAAAIMIQFIERRINLWLFMGCTAGLAWPYWSWAPDTLVAAILMIATYIACFRLSGKELRAIAWPKLVMFLLLRYLLLGWLIYWLFSLILPTDIALAAMLIVALPAGVSSPAVTHLMGGQVTLAVVITLLTTILAPFTIPLLFSAASSHSIAPSPADLLQSLTLILLLPCVIFLFTRHIKPLAARVETYGKSTVILLTALMLAIVVGKQREFVLSDIPLLITMIVLTCALLGFLLWLGWAGGRHMQADARIAMATTSGFNNAALGVALAALHFSPMVVLVMVAAEVAWATLPYMMHWLKKNPSG